MSIFDMGKNLKFGDSSKDEPFSISGINKNGTLIDPRAEFAFTGKFPKKRGRPKMTETFFYDPYEKETGIFVGVDTANLLVGDVLTIDTDRMGYITNVIDGDTVEINWRITYKE